MHDRVELPEPLTLVGLTLHEVLLVARDTVPANPFCPVIVIEDVPALPTFTVTLVGLALIVKSWTVKVTVAVRVKDPLVPVTVTCTVLAEVKVHESVELPEVVTLVGDRVQAVLLLDRLTVPVKPFRGVIVMVDVAAVPALTVTEVGLAVTEKS